MSKKCGMGCDEPAEHGGFYCNTCLSRWARQTELKRQKEIEATQARGIRALRDEIAELKREIEEQKP